MKFKANVYVTLKMGVLDPQGKAVLGALKNLEFNEVNDVRVGKFIELRLDAESEDQAEQRLWGMCEELLANPVIEDAKLELEEIE